MYKERALTAWPRADTGRNPTFAAGTANSKAAKAKSTKQYIQTQNITKHNP